MSVYGISGNAGLVAFRHRPYLQNMGATGSQAVDTSQGGQTVPQTVPAGPQAAGGTSQAQNSFSALLGGMAVGEGSQDGTLRSQGAGMQPPPPTPGAEGGQGSSFGSSLMSLLQSVLSGDMAGAQSAAAAIQSVLGGAVSPDSGAPVSVPSTSSSGTVSSMAPAAASVVSPATDPGGAQSEFMTGLNSLLTAVQSGDQTASKTAAATLVFYMASRQDGMGPPPIPQEGGDAGSFRSSLASLLRSVQSGDMPGAQAVATAMRNALNSTESQSSTSTSPAPSPRS